MQKEFTLTDQERYYARVFYTALKMELSKFLILLAVFALFGAVKEFLAAFLTFAIIRGNMGGLHCKGYGSCLMLTFAVFVNAVLLLPAVCSLSQWQYILALVFCAILVCMLKPVLNPTRPVPERNKVLKNKLKVFAAILCLIAYAVVTDYNSYVVTAYWVVIQQLLLLFFANIKAKEETGYYVHY